MTIDSLVSTMTNAMESAKTPANVLPPLLLKCTSMVRPGLSAYKIASEIIKNNKEIGIPTEPGPDGSPNKINQYTYNVVKCIVDAIKNDASVQSTIPMGSVMVQANGGNAGGPVVAIGYNVMDSICRGIMQ